MPVVQKNACIPIVPSSTLLQTRLGETRKADEGTLLGSLFSKRRDTVLLSRSGWLLFSGSILNICHRAGGEGGLWDSCAQFPIYGLAEFKIKGSFYNDKNIRTTEKCKNHSKTIIFRKRKLIQCPFKFT